jgi:hypothetical protein
MKTATYYPTRHFWAVCVLLAALVLGFDARPAAAQGQAQTFTGDVTISGNIPARFVATVAPDGSVVVYLTAPDTAGGSGSAMRFVGRFDGNRIRAVARDRTELTGTVHRDRVVGTVGNLGWGGVVTATGAASPTD